LTVLDVGCGSQKRGDIGIDNRKLPGVDVICDAHHLPFKSMVFEGCFAFALLEHVESPRLVLAEIKRTLKSRGWLKVLVPTDSRLRSDYLTRIFLLHFKDCWATYSSMRRGEHKWQFTMSGLDKILTNVGFRVERMSCRKLTRLFVRYSDLIAEAHLTT
jgi:ubiquinone/menaquinone biosynthesis C-methylase UbiE